MTPASAVRVCQNCGRSILAEAEFCPHCGARQDRPRRSPFTVLLDLLVAALVLLMVLLFGLAGICALLLGGRGGNGGAFLSLAIGIALLLAAASLVKYLRRRRETRR